MNKFIFMDLLNSCGILGIALLIGVFLRAKIKFLQSAFIPASLIAGVLLLALGQLGFKFVHFNDEYVNIWRLLPGILIVPIVASVALGLKSVKNCAASTLQIALIIFVVSMLQFCIGLSAQFIFPTEFYPTFGLELGIGFVGGHGTSGFLAKTLTDINAPYALSAVSIAITTATFGLVGGILLGVIFINYACRNNLTSILKTPADISQSIKIGIEKDRLKQPVIGQASVLESSADALGVHLALILGVCVLAYFAKELLSGIKYIGSISIWGYAIVLMFIINKLLHILKIEYLVDSRIRSKISGSMTDFAVTAAIASMDLRAVMDYFWPIIYMCALGFLLTAALLYLFMKFFMRSEGFEHSIACWGCCTGVFLTGILLLRISDPEQKTPAMSNYSLGYALSGLVFFAILPQIVIFCAQYGAIMGFALIFALGLVSFLCMLALKIFKF